MNKRKKLAAVVLVLCGLTLLSHGVDVRMGHAEPQTPEYHVYSRVVQPGQSLWDICARIDSSEDIRTIIDRARVDNDVADPGAMQPGKVLMIRYKR